MKNLKTLALLGAVVCTTTASFGDVFHDYDDLTEGFLGQSYDYNGVQYHDVNNVSGVFPDGSTFGPTDLGNEVIIENAALFYNDFPGYGSANNSMTFGTSFVPGDNLTIGALASVWMTPDDLGNAASFDIAYYENGPWGGIVWHLDATRNGSVVASDEITISDADSGRDNPTFATMAVSGAEFDALHLYSTWQGDYTGARGMIDNLSITSVPAPGALALLGVAGLARRRRRRG